jgi:hypothetical protein
MRRALDRHGLNCQPGELMSLTDDIRTHRAETGLPTAKQTQRQLLIQLSDGARHCGRHGDLSTLWGAAFKRYGYETHNQELKHGRLR